MSREKEWVLSGSWCFTGWREYVRREKRTETLWTELPSYSPVSLHSQLSPENNHVFMKLRWPVISQSATWNVNPLYTHPTIPRHTLTDAEGHGETPCQSKTLFTPFSISCITPWEDSVQYLDPIVLSHRYHLMDFSCVVLSWYKNRYWKR